MKWKRGRGMARPDVNREAMAFDLNFLWLLSLFQDKESDKSTIQESC